MIGLVWRECGSQRLEKKRRRTVVACCLGELLDVMMDKIMTGQPWG